ncbi:MAG TPA: hypothetical protein VN362_24375, partial [Xanthobacteraceae bacterium]|nr:hypothetical protein [Xanthobacteraceae bacterium]
FIAKTRDAYVYENPRALPRVMVVHDYRIADFDMLIRHGWPDDADPRRIVLLEHAPAAAAVAAGGPPAMPDGSGIPGAAAMPDELVQRFRKTDHMRTDFQFVIPGRPPGRAFGAPDGRLREAEANPESITPASGYGFRALRPSAFGQSLPSGAPKARPGGSPPGMTTHMIRTSKSLY